MSLGTDPAFTRRVLVSTQTSWFAAVSRAAQDAAGRSSCAANADQVRARQALPAPAAPHHLPPATAVRPAGAKTFYRW